MKLRKRIAIIISSTLVASLLLAVAIPFLVLSIKSSVINNKYQYLLDNHEINEKKIEVPLVKQEISCGYAIIDMLSNYYGNRVSEEELYNRNNKGISTSSTSGFVKEINKTIPHLKCASKEYLKNDELLKQINKSLMNNNPVAVEWAAKLEDTWTLHWSIVTGMDLEKVYINNPYGYKEEITYSEFISRTTFKAFKNMNIGYEFGFVFGLFSKNTIIIAE